MIYKLLMSLICLVLSVDSNATQWKPAPIATGPGRYREANVEAECRVFKKYNTYIIGIVIQGKNNYDYNLMQSGRIYLYNTRYKRILRTFAGGENITPGQHYGLLNMTHLYVHTRKTMKACVLVSVVFASTSARNGHLAEYIVRVPLVVKELK